MKKSTYITHSDGLAVGLIDDCIHDQRRSLIRIFRRETITHICTDPILY
jgi:hypothetical protein